MAKANAPHVTLYLRCVSGDIYSWKLKKKLEGEQPLTRTYYEKVEKCTATWHKT